MVFAWQGAAPCLRGGSWLAGGGAYSEVAGVGVDRGDRGGGSGVASDRRAV